MHREAGIYPVVEIESFDQIADSVFERELNHFASELFEVGIYDLRKIEQSVLRAIKVCKAANIPIRENFRAVYVCGVNEIHRDWRLSDLALRLVVINADTSNPMVARAQMQLVNGS